MASVTKTMQKKVKAPKLNLPKYFYSTERKRRLYQCPLQFWIGEDENGQLINQTTVLLLIISGYILLIQT